MRPLDKRFKSVTAQVDRETLAKIADLLGINRSDRAKLKAGTIHLIQEDAGVGARAKKPAARKTAAKKGGTKRA